MRRLLITLALCAGFFVSTPAIAQMSLDTAKVTAAWQRVLECSQIEPVPGGDLKDVKWFIYPAGSRLDEYGNRILGEWVAPDTIRIDSVYADSSLVIAHELLHHLIHARQDITNGDVHPWVPFAFPCQLMPWQHYGGIMQYHTRPTEK
jgi:hypothetical protein